MGRGKQKEWAHCDKKSDPFARQEEEEDLSQVEEEPDCDVYDDRITPEQWQELFGESDDEEFHGF